MPKLGYIIGFAVVFFLLSSVVGSAFVIGLRVGESKGDPGSVGDPGAFGRVLADQGRIAQIAEEIAERTQGKTNPDDPDVQYYRELLKEHQRGPDCTSCSSFTFVVMRESGADLTFPNTTADDQFRKLLVDSRYHTYTIDPQARSVCGNRMVETPKRGDLIFSRKVGVDEEGQAEVRNYGHAAVYIGFRDGKHIAASASYRTRSPKIKQYNNIASFIDCGARLISPS